ncbi:MAG TPA: sugar phosphate isomerase/epimerase family protein, partial [Ardenticatenaceae bacterium]|nr:sugar phosphate isomerase/epimerase family protein [Ardenticatenaceae bacterium]
MCAARFTLSAFGDEIAADPVEQFRVLARLEVRYLELRAAWGKNVVGLDDDDVASLARMCARYGISVSCVGSPVGKSTISEPLEREIGKLTRLFEIGRRLGTRRVRVFSFYPPDTSSNRDYDWYLEEAAQRLGTLTDLARREGFHLLLENEREIVGDTPARCHALLGAIEDEHLRFAWDPANFVQVGVARPTESGWPLLGRYVAHVHVKDASLADGSVRAAGEGDGQVGELLSALRRTGYHGFLALEPHLVAAGRSGGFSGPEGMA